ASPRRRQAVDATPGERHPRRSTVTGQLVTPSHARQLRRIRTGIARDSVSAWLTTHVSPPRCFRFKLRAPCVPEKGEYAPDSPTKPTQRSCKVVSSGGDGSSKTGQTA